MSSELSGSQYKQFHKALLKAYPGEQKLARMVEFGLNENLNEFAFGDLSNQAFELIRWAQARGRLLDLVQAALDENPGNEFLRRFAEAFGAVPDAAGLEKLVRGDPEAFNDPDGWRETMARRERAVCRVEYAWDQPDGTGFLVGPDLLVTNYHVCQPVWEGTRPPTDVQFRFGYRVLATQQEVRGTTVGLAAKDWLLDSDPPGQKGLDFVLLRLARAVGREPAESRPKAPPRGWLAPQAYEFGGKEMVFVLQHPKGWPLKHACGPVAQKSNPFVTYAASTLPGSSGSPVFLNNWSLVALHHRAHETEANEGIAFAALLQRPAVKEAVQKAGTPE